MSRGRMSSERVVIGVRRKPGTEDVPLPKYMSAHASGMDVCAAVGEPIRLGPGEIRLVPTGLHIAVPPGYEAQIRPRSGLALKHGITVVNSPGTIDSDYRGEVCVILGNMGGESFVIRRGDRIAQMVIQRTERAQWELSDELAETERHTAGFGSTGQ